MPDDPHIAVHSLTPDSLLSGGQRQSIAIGRGHFPPQVLILDEPDRALRGTRSREGSSADQNFARQGVPVVFITHRLQDVFRACD